MAAIVAGLILLPSAWVGSAPLASTAPAETATQPDGQAQLQQHIEAIRSSKEPTDALNHYAKACSINRWHADVHEAYIRTMLSLGLPQKTRHAARILTRIAPDNALGWALMGYFHARNDDYREALIATVRAWKRDKTNIGIQHNLAVLLAWRSAEARNAKIPKEVHRAIYQAETASAMPETYKKARARAEERYKQYRRKKTEYEKRVADQEQAIQPLKDKLEQLRRTVIEINTRIEATEAIRDRLRRRLGYVEGKIDNPETRAPGDTYPRLIRLRSDLREQLEKSEDAIDKLEIEKKLTIKRGKLTLHDLKKNQKRLEALEAEREKAVDRFRPELFFDPPAIDGEVIPEVSPTKYKTPDAAPPADSQAQARSKLRLARLYLKNRMPEKARRILKTIIANWPDTQTAAESRALLKALQEK
ncbi:MAG: hypothetical protein ACLFVU_08440 [Phycisphaerae bacterium]